MCGVCVFTPGYVLNSVSCQHGQVLDELRHDRVMEEDETGNIRGVKNREKFASGNGDPVVLGFCRRMLVVVVCVGWINKENIKAQRCFDIIVWEKKEMDRFSFREREREGDGERHTGQK